MRYPIKCVILCVCVKYQLKQGDEIKSYHSSHSSSIHNQQLISEGCDAVGDGDATQKAGASKSRFRMRRRATKTILKKVEVEVDCVVAISFRD